MKKGKFIIISGPSGVGKDTLADLLIKRINGIYSVSMTTREKRHYEKEGVDYFFRTKEEFQKYIDEDKFFEHATYNNNYYGTLKDFVFDNINKGIDVISVIEIKGAMQIEKVYSDALSIFIMPPSFEELERRLRNRNSNTEEDIQNRLEIAKEEIKYKDRYDYVVINNTVDEAVDELVKIVEKERNK